MINFSRSFTARAEQIIKFSSLNIAKEFNSSRIELEHICIAILREKDSITTRVLKDLGVDLNILCNDVEDITDKFDKDNITGPILPSRNIEILIESSMEEAKNMGYNYVGTEHLFLAIFQQNNHSLIQIFDKHNITLPIFKEKIVKIIGFGRTINKKEFISKKTPLLDEFSVDLTALAKRNKLDKVIGREKEIERVIQVLSRRSKNNPILLGEPGVGKTSIVDGLSQKIVNNLVPDTMIGKRVVSLDLGQIIARTKYRGEFEERLEKIIKEARGW